VSYDPAAWQIFEVHSRSGTCVSYDNHLLAPVVDSVTGTRVLAITQENFKCVSIVAGVGLQDLANRANQISVSN
jgi:hypothetical protein